MVLRQPTRLVIVLLLVASVTGAAVADHDEHEPNDDFDSASSIAVGSYTNLHVADGESDFYAVDLAAGEELTVDVLFTHDDGDLDLTVYDTDRDEMDYSVSMNDDESVTVTADEPGTYYLEVYGFTDDSNTYDMELSTVEGMEPDEFEPNDDFDEAAPVDDGLHHELTVVSGESDFYAVDLTQGEELTVDVLFTHDDGDLDLTIYDPDHDGIDSSVSLSNDESVTVTADEPGTHYVEVYGFSGASNDYHLGIERSGGVTPTPTETPTPTDDPTTSTETPTSTPDDGGQGDAGDGGDGGDVDDGDDGGDDQDDISIEVSPGFESWTAVVALLAVLAVLRRR